MLGGSFMKLGTTLNGMSGAFRALGRSRIWAGERPPEGACAPPEGACAPPEGACAPPEGACANMVTAPDSASAAARPTELLERVVIRPLDSGAMKPFTMHLRLREAGVLYQTFDHQNKNRTWRDALRRR